MAYELVEDVLDHAPEGMSVAERLILVCIAEEARKGTRMAEIPQARLRKRTGLGEEGLKTAIRRLRDRGYEVRVPFAKDRHGKPIYAIPGRTCTYLVPAFDRPIGCDCRRCKEGVAVTPPPKEGVAQTPTAGAETPTAGVYDPTAGVRATPNQSGEPYGLSPDHAAPPSRAPQGRDDVAAAKQWARQRIAEAQKKNRQSVHRREGSAMAALNQAVLRIVPPPAEPEGATA